MSLFPIKTIQTCCKCGEDFIHEGNTFDTDIEVKCKDCNNPCFKGYELEGMFNIKADF